jgi:putative transposase
MKQTLTPGLARVFKRLHYAFDVMLMCVRWYVAYRLSVRNLEEMMAERGIEVDHSTMHRWAIKLLPILGKTFRRHKRPVGKSGVWMRRISRSKDSGSICIEPWTKPARRSISLLRAHRDKAASQGVVAKIDRCRG